MTTAAHKFTNNCTCNFCTDKHVQKLQSALEKFVKDTGVIGLKLTMTSIDRISKFKLELS